MKRLLVLTSATGAGHDTHAQATKEWCQKIYGESVEVRIEHVLEDSHFINRLGVRFYNWIQQHAPWVHHGYFQLVELLDTLNGGGVSLGKDYYINLLESYRPHVILSVHDCLNRGYFESARKCLGEELRCATFCAEFSGGYGFSKNWVNPKLGFFLGRTVESVEQARALSLPEDRVTVVGHWSQIAFYEKPLLSEITRKFLSETMGLSPDIFTLLLSTGGAGAQNHQKILAALHVLNLPIQVIALCGREEKSRATLEKWSKKEVAFPVRALGFRDDMVILYQACSAVLARAGATTAGEALLMDCPIIFNAMGGIMPQEMPTWRYFKKHGVGSLACSAQAVAQIVALWIEQPELYQAARQKMKPLRNLTTPEKALKLLLDSN